MKEDDKVILFFCIWYLSLTGSQMWFCVFIQNKEMSKQHSENTARMG